MNKNSASKGMGQARNRRVVWSYCVCLFPIVIYFLPYVMIDREQEIRGEGRDDLHQESNLGRRIYMVGILNP